MKLNPKYFLSIIFSLVLAMPLVAYGQSEAPGGSEAEGVKQAPVPSEILMEDLDDPSQWDQPRIQFFARHPYKKNKWGHHHNAIWSVKVDGSDLRMAWSFEHLAEEDDGLSTQVMVRSPNNRYLAVVVNNNKGAPRILVDLKTNEYWIMELHGGSTPGFTWTADSSAVIFNSGVGNWRYEVASHTLSPLSDDIRGLHMFLLKDQKTLLGVSDYYYAYYDLATGKQLKRVVLPDVENILYAELSPNEDKLFYKYKMGLGMGVVNLNTDEEFFRTRYLYKLPNGERLKFGDAVFNDLGNTLLYQADGYLYYLDITNQTATQGKPMSSRLLRATLINKQVLWDK